MTYGQIWVSHAGYFGKNMFGTELFEILGGDSRIHT